MRFELHLILFACCPCWVTNINFYLFKIGISTKHSWGAVPPVPSHQLTFSDRKRKGHFETLPKWKFPIAITYQLWLTFLFAWAIARSYATGPTIIPSPKVDIALNLSPYQNILPKSPNKINLTRKSEPSRFRCYPWATVPWSRHYKQPTRHRFLWGPSLENSCHLLCLCIWCSWHHRPGRLPTRVWFQYCRQSFVWWFSVSGSMGRNKWRTRL